MKQVMIKKIMTGVILGCLSATGLTGCTTSAYINPFTFLSGILATDNTSFFETIYTALMQAGAATSVDQEDTE
jgi:hypothetical protein